MKLAKEQIKFLNRVCAGACTLNSDGEVDVRGSVFMSNMYLTEIPVKFGEVSGGFYCSHNQLTSLEFCPSEVGGDFYCDNNQLTSLEFCPPKVGGDFSCSDNQLTSLEFAPTFVGSDFKCYGNQLTNYFKSIKEEDFPYWNNLYWYDVLGEYPFLINIGKRSIKNLKLYLDYYPLTKLYLE